MSVAGTCRAIAQVFNRRFALKRKMTVGRTFVNELIRKHHYEVEIVRRQIKNAKPKPVPRNFIWGLDLTDNEAVFTSRVFRLALFLLGIRHQRIDPHCPWQNGRVERFFGTLKANLDQLTVDSLWALNAALAEFRFFYNHVRAHQNLDGRTPAEAWAAVDPFTARIRQEYWFEAWDGLLRGYYLRR